jgi:hypothetical protein
LDYAISNVEAMVKYILNAKFGTKTSVNDDDEFVNMMLMK